MKFKHYTLLLLALVTFFTSAIAQPRIKDQRVIGGAGEDDFSTMNLTKDGGFIVGGSSISDSGFQKTQNGKGGYDYWVVKLDSSKNIQWDKTIGANDNDYLKAVQQTNDGGYILGGYSYSGLSGDKTEASKGGYDYWIVRLDSNGNIQWDKTIGGSSYDYLLAMQQTTDGGYILGGFSASGISGDKTEADRGPYDYWVVKLDAAGNKMWDKTVGGTDLDELGALQQTSDGGYILGGHSYSKKSGDKTTANKGSSDYWIVKLDASGNVQWDKTIGGNGYENLYTIQQTANGGYIMGGYSNSGISGSKTEASKGSYDYWIVKTNSIGIVQWDKTIGGPDYDNFTDLKQTSDGGFVLTGYSTSGIGGDKTEANRGSYDYWVVKTGSTGNVQWDKTIGGNNDDEPYAVREVKKNDYLIGGSSNSTISGDKTGGVRGKSSYYDYWLVELKYVKPNSIAVTPIAANKLAAPQQNTTTAFAVYPNPAINVLHIQNVGKATFVLTDFGGKRILSKTIDGNADVNVASIPAGTYYLTNTTTRITQKIIITK